MLVGEALHGAGRRLRESGSESARLDAELLLAHVLGVDRSTILAHPERSIGQAQLAAYQGSVDRRTIGEPVAYIRGVKEFFGLAFAVDARALIPRPETETLVELALARVTEVLSGACGARGGTAYRIRDVGTGSGAVAVSLAVSLRRRGYAGAVQVVATDTSPDALALAAENVASHGVSDMVMLGLADLLAEKGDWGVAGDEGDAADEAIGGDEADEGGQEGQEDKDLVVGNLPYVPSAEVPRLPVAASFEPLAALDGGPDGLLLIRRLLAQLPRGLAAGGQALLEIGSDKDDALRAAVERTLPGWTVAVHPDLSGQPRVARVTRRETGTRR